MAHTKVTQSTHTYNTHTVLSAVQYSTTPYYTYYTVPLQVGLELCLGHELSVVDPRGERLEGGDVADRRRTVLLVVGLVAAEAGHEVVDVDALDLVVDVDPVRLEHGGVVDGGQHRLGEALGEGVLAGALVAADEAVEALRLEEHEVHEGTLERGVHAPRPGVPEDPLRRRAAQVNRLIARELGALDQGKDDLDARCECVEKGVCVVCEVQKSDALR